MEVVRGLLHKYGRMRMTQGAPAIEYEPIVIGGQFKAGGVLGQDCPQIQKCPVRWDRDLTIRQLDLW